MDKSHYVIVHEALTKLGVKLGELFRRAKLAKDPEKNSLLSEQAAKRDYERFKDAHEFPNYLLEFSLDATGYRALTSSNGSHTNVRSLEARRSGVVDLNAKRSNKHDDTK
jgi:hypothetical protein